MPFKNNKYCGKNLQIYVYSFWIEIEFSKNYAGTHKSFDLFSGIRDMFYYHSSLFIFRGISPSSFIITILFVNSISYVSYIN